MARKWRLLYVEGDDVTKEYILTDTWLIAAFSEWVMGMVQLCGLLKGKPPRRICTFTCDFKPDIQEVAKFLNG